MPYALENIRVVEIGGYIVGAYCATLLANMGAEVVKIEPLTGDGLRGQLGSFQGWNRGKRGMAVDFHFAEGRAILRKLVLRADVLVQNLRPGVAEEWEVDHETVTKLNPRLVYLAMPGYGLTGPYADRPAFDPLLQARSGAMAAQGGQGNPPVYLRSAISDYSGAMLGAWGVAMALYGRAKTGKGQFLHGALLNAAMAIQAGEFIDYEGKPASPRLGNAGTSALYRFYKTADEYILISAESDEQWRALCTVLGKAELAADLRFSTPRKRLDNMRELSAILEPAFATKPTAYWSDLLDKAGVPNSRLNRFRDLFEHPQVIENGLISEHDSVDVGPLKQLGQVVNLSETPGKLWRAAPALGQHNDEVLGELGYRPEEITKLRETGVIK